MKATSLLLFLFFSHLTFAKDSWTIVPGSNLGFTENKNRFSEIMNEEIQFFNQIEGVTLLFSNQSIIIGQSKEKFSERNEGEKETEEHVTEVEWNYYKIQFLNSNPSVSISGVNVKPYTRNFQSKTEPTKTIKAPVYEKLIYRSIYPNIDLEFEIPENGGLKYTFIVHPGGNYQKIQMKYTGLIPTLTEDGNLNLIHEDVHLIDEAPQSYVNNKPIESEFVSVDNTVHFKVDSYDTTQQLIIDPWIHTDIGGDYFWESIFEIAHDNEENCAIIINTGSGYEEIFCYDVNGDLKWTWLTPLGAGADIAINPATGSIYITKFGAYIGYLDPTGTLINSFDITVAATESIRVRYNRFNDQVCSSLGGFIGDESDVIVFDPALSYINDVEIFIAPSSTMEDCALFETDPEDGSMYLAPSILAPWHNTIYTHKLFKVDALDPSIILWESYRSQYFSEGYPTYNAVYRPASIGVNGIACGYDFVYTYDGNTILKYDKDSGALEDSISLGISPHNQYGLDLDDCGNVYVGTEDSVLVFTADLVQINGFSVPGPCHDLSVGLEKLYVCGDDFVTKIKLDLVSTSVSSTPSSCGEPNGTVQIESDNCEGFLIDKVTWSPGGYEGETITGLVPGWYYASIIFTNREGDQLTKEDSVEVLNDKGNLIVETEINPANCTADCSGTIKLYPQSGTPPYSFDIGVATNVTGIFSGVCTGTYPLQVYDSNGCHYNDTLFVSRDCPDSAFYRIPNIISPNQDNINDQFAFIFKNTAISSFSCTIVNRWGTVVSRLEGTDDFWTGNDLNGQSCPDGVYFYTFEFETVDGEIIKGQGNIQLVR